MTYVYAGLISLVGFLLGAAAALWYRYKAARAEGQVSTLREKNANLEKENATLQTNVEQEVLKEAALIVEQQKQIAKYEKVIQDHVRQEAQYRELLSQCTDPALLIERFRVLFPPKT